MKNKGVELSRIKSIIINDRFKTKDCFLELLNKDVTKLLSDYFDFRGKVEISINKESVGYLLDLKLSVDRLKSFGMLPNEQ